MSRAYRIQQKVRVRESLTKDVKVGDEICTDLEIWQILPKDQIRQLLKKSAKNRGFQEDPQGKMVRQQDGLTITIDPTTGRTTIQLEEEAEITVNQTQEGWIYKDEEARRREQVQNQLRQAVRQELEQLAEQKEEELQRQVSAQLEAQLGEISKELDDMINEVTREALKRKAHSLGAIKELTEDPQAGSLTIKIEV